MNVYLVRLLFLGFSLFLGYELTAQLETTSDQDYAYFLEGVYKLDSFKNDEAFIILDSLYVKLQQEDKLDKNFGLRVMFRRAEALLKDEQNEAALIELYKVSNLSQSKKVWDVYAHAGLMLARLFENIERDSLCFDNLMKVKSTISKNPGLDSLYPLYAIRISSYNRIFADQDSALFYANEAKRTAPLYNQFGEIAVAHMLLGMIDKEAPLEDKVEHFKSAAKAFRMVQDYTGYAYMMGNISRLYYKNDNPDVALVYNDSSIWAANKSIKNGHEARSTLWSHQQDRAKIFQALSKSDSAWLYLNEGYQTQIDYIHQTNNEKVIAAESKYQDEQKNLKIDAQNKQLIIEKAKNNTILIISSIVLFFTGLLSLAYINLFRANRKTKQQSALIKTKNKALSSSLEQQVILQGEVHHRVKNNLQVIISLLDKQNSKVSDPIASESLNSMSKRIYSMAAIHEIIYQQEDMSKVDFNSYVHNLCEAFSNFSLKSNKPDFHISVGNFKLNLETSMPIGIMLTELLTNSLKYARKENERLSIEIVMQLVENKFLLTYKDNGPGFPSTFLADGTGGLGSYLLKSMSRQLNAKYQFKNQKGAEFQLFFNEKNEKIKII